MTYLQGFSSQMKIFQKSNSSKAKDNHDKNQMSSILPIKNKLVPNVKKIYTFEETLKKSHTSCCSATLAIDNRSYKKVA